MPRFIHQSHGLLALGRGLICPAPRGGVAGLAGAGQCLGTGRGAGPAAGPAAPSLTRWAAAGRAPSVAAGRRPAARPSPAPCLTARAPRLVSGSAIFTHYRSRCRAKATGRRGHRPLPPRPRLQAAVGLDPLPPSPIPGGPALQEGRLSKLTRSAACPWLPDVAGAGSCSCRKPLPLSAGASRAGPQFKGPYAVTRPPGGLRVTRAPGTACKKMCESICLRDEEPTASIGFPQGLRPVGSPESLSAS